MKILEHKAAHVLFEQVKYLDDHPHDIWRCIYLNLSNKKSKFNQELREHFVMDNVEKLLEDVDGEVYLCEDGDVFILFKGALSPVVKKLGAHFKGLLPEPLWQQPSDDMYTIFDLSKYWKLFFNLCRAKERKEDRSEEDILLKVTNEPAVVQDGQDTPIH